MAPSILDDPEGLQLFMKAKELVANGEFIKALELIEDLMLAHKEGEASWLLHAEQGDLFMKISETAEDPDLRTAYILAIVECCSQDVKLSRHRAQGLCDLGHRLGSVMFFKECLEVAKQGLSFADHTEYTNPLARLLSQNLEVGKREDLERLIGEAEFMIAESKTSPLTQSEAKVLDPKESPDPRENVVKTLKAYWMGLDAQSKRDFMKVSIEKLRFFIEGVHNREGVDALENVLAFARERKKWSVWACRTLCLMEFSTAEECKTHLEQEHAADFKPCSEKDIVERIGKKWAHKIPVGGWEPVDTVAAVEMIKNQLAHVKAFTSKSKKNGWSTEWPLAADEERLNLLQEIKLLLVSLCDRKLLSCSVRDWVMRFPAKHLGKFEVSRESLIDVHLLDSPQSICFLERLDLIQIRNLLKNIKCERRDGTDMVCRGVDSLLDRTRVKENIDFDTHYSLVLLDKRLLKRSNAPFDDEGKINLIDDPETHYAEAKVQGDDIISWLVDYDSVDKSISRPVREHNLGIWVALLRDVQYSCRALGTKYAKKRHVLDYEEALAEVEKLCTSEDERRRDLQEDQWKSYASLLCDKCEERVPGNSLSAKLFLCAVRDVLDGAWRLTFDFPDLEDCLNLIREGKCFSDNMVLMSIDFLKSMVTDKVLLIDSKILLIDNSRIRLLNNLTRLSVFDHRSYMLQLLKPFLLFEIVNMESKAKAEAAETMLLLNEEKSQAKKKTRSTKNEIVNMESKAKTDPTDAAEAMILINGAKKSQAQKKKKASSIKITSTSSSSPLCTTVKHEHSVKPEPEEGSMVPEDTQEEPKKVDRSEISSNADIQEEPNKVDQDMQNMPGEDSQSGHLEQAFEGAAARYNSALDMTLKALMNINVLKEDLQYNKQPFHDDLEEQVPYALQNLFSAVVSWEIKTEGVYSVILSDLLASLEEVIPMSSNAAEVLLTILESWHCWKNSERKSLVTRLFTVEEFEWMRCRKCRRRPNHPEQSSYGIVMPADSIRDLKCAFGDIKFVDILKLIRLELKMFCDIETGGCGTRNFVQHVMSRRPLIFTIVLKWENGETEKEISETTNALEWEIDISKLYEGLDPNTNYRLVSMVGYNEEVEEHVCIVYEKNRWVNLRRESLEGEVVGNWKSVVRFCGERKVRPEILLYEAARSIA
ncbi:unnamed protein product [Microthlaspi erraticum]|uniref:C2H2-type domain-containing protein n=1 Tax=Microthlaspi erraticum TaxID=1685480 RepID=A0A6D2J5Y0_9BRAS|nr:unnamed protein product [Microthlaspi erraticum]